MLTRRIKAGDKFEIGTEITLTIKEDPGKGRLMMTINAPREVNITRVAAEKPEKHNI